MAIKSKNNWYKFLSEAVDQRLNEISQQSLEDTKLEKYLKGKIQNNLKLFLKVRSVLQFHLSQKNLVIKMIKNYLVILIY